MARKYQSFAHAKARNGYACLICGHVLRNAKYAGEFTYVYAADGSEKMTSVYLDCQHCRTVNQVSIDVTDNSTFMDVVEDVTSIPRRAQKITKAPVMAETSGDSIHV